MADDDQMQDPADPSNADAGGNLPLRILRQFADRRGNEGKLSHLRHERAGGSRPA